MASLHEIPDGEYMDPALNPMNAISNAEAARVITAALAAAGRATQQSTLARDVANAVPAEDLPKVRKLLDDLMNGVKEREKAVEEKQKVLDGAPETEAALPRMMDEARAWTGGR